jgi:ketosteroid isomerase-like protein
MDEPDMPPVTEDRVRQIYDDFAKGRLDRLAEAFDEHVDFLSHAPRDYFPYLGRRRGRAEVMKAFEELHEKLEVISFCPLTVLAGENDAALTVFMRIKDRASGQFATFMGAHFLRFRKGLITGYFGIIDSLEAVRQLTDTEL